MPLYAFAYAAPVSPLGVTSDNYSKITTVIDSSIVTSTSTFAVRGNSSESTVFLSGKDLYAFVKSFATSGAPNLRELDFANLQAPAPPKEEAKIEGAVQIAIGVKKEVDFPTWYTNVLTKAEVRVPVLLVALVYIDRAKPHLQIALEQWACERVFLGALILANKVRLSPFCCRIPSMGC